ncbi:hypothetical protein PtrSN002B_004181 [Pyrenophora tritici-repentis]|nr:hypothetical protein PtrSN001A_003861 [Pyrenophora tritici-repentis]KAI1554155.1 hypothetical protein PtrSN002B_004181 [Pyrenophora tritici-repentis]KAI1584184.1 hypothetical protein PtrEW7m1_002860 [Pyrenophora tritici-repentis]KAI2475698.1 hypothetical protein Ptr902_12873 [Pyrenophora tritici-repentis]PWO27831.1 hypothetical protein PtrARCrB10_03576 [Pyrenophora tritici-repentis]
MRSEENQAASMEKHDTPKGDAIAENISSSRLPAASGPVSDTVNSNWILPPSEIHDGRLYRRVG